MKNLLISVALGCLMIPINIFAEKRAVKKNSAKDTLNVKCKIFAANLYYGIELGEKPTATMVDTLVGEIQQYDTDAELNLVVVTGRDLGFTSQTNILWQQVLDSAECRGYGICPPQIGPEVFVLSQNIPSQRTLLSRAVIGSRPIFIGMDRISHDLQMTNKPGFHHSRHRNYFDYVFCIKSSQSKRNYELGYCATNTVTNSRAYTWSYNDKFIFVNKPHSCKISITYYSK